ncbi:Pre-splicing factor 38 [Sesamum alatum]|uniref:Pre-mRNA-splicing factor 38 n=1 Tax=Sesamum alatum TaxID=300844 RepID=A0AAE2CJL5_9LAMI|nr:Pre-splicing factor 38 [Sesamum alatum]
MANRTDPLAKSIRGTNPQNLVEKILRTKIYQNTYWKEQCFGLTAETLVDKAMEIDHLGGTHGGNRKPTPFMCLVMKMLQIQPDKEIVVEFIKNPEYKYVRALGAFYLRLTGTDVDVYRYLEPLYNDYRKLRLKLNDGKFTLTHVDEFINELLTRDYSCDIVLPRIRKRLTLETIDSLEPRRSALEDDFEEEEEKDEDDQLADGLDSGGQEAHDKDYYGARSPTRERGRDRRRDNHRYRDRDYDRERDYDKVYDRDRGRGRDRDGERDRERDRDRRRPRDEKDYGHERDREREREREREGRERERRDRERGRRRSHSRSRSRSRDRKDRDGDDRRKRPRSSASPKRRGGRSEDARAEPRKKKEKANKDDGTDHPDPEIAEQNRLRASLGLKPLKL